MKQVKKCDQHDSDITIIRPADPCKPAAQGNYHKLDWEPRDFSHREQSDIPSGIRILSPVHMPILLQGHKVGGAGFEPARPIKRNGFTVRRHRPTRLIHLYIVPVVGFEPTRGFPQRGLNPLCLPISPYRHIEEINLQ